MIFRVHPPSLPLGAHVEYFWYHEGFVSDYALERLMPDGGVELILDLRNEPKEWREIDGDKSTHAVRRSWISGQHIRPIAIEAAQNSCMIGARFRPGGAHAVLALPLSDLNGSVVEMDLLWGDTIHELRERLLAATSVDARFAILEAALLWHARGRLEVDRTLACALAQIAARTEPVSIRRMAGEIGVSQRRLVQLFETRVGLKPKLFARVMRFQRVLRRLERTPRPSWSALAAAYGYVDQSHFIRDFRALSGFTPTEYMHRKGEYLNFVPMR